MTSGQSETDRWKGAHAAQNMRMAEMQDRLDGCKAMLEKGIEIANRGVVPPEYPTMLDWAERAEKLLARLS